MRRRHGDRAVTVQIGAVLLLAIVFAALALYQVNAVPAENQAIESEHNQQVTNELQDVRNAIGAAGFGGSTRSASVTLGTSYPTRTFLTNPPNPTGRLETTDPGSVRINDSSGTEYAYETRFLAYEPDYNEYRDAPRTVIEHSLLYNQFDEANVSVGSQQLVGSERISLVLLDGNRSETSGRATSVSLESLDEPRTKELAEGSSLTIPTERPAVWESELEDNAGVTVGKTADGEIEIELERQYTLDIARVGVGEGASSAPGFTIGSERTPADTDRAGGAYEVQWDTERMANESDRVTCTNDGCTVSAPSAGDSVPAFVTTSPDVDGATVEYAVSDDENATFEPGTGTVQNGANSTSLVAESNGTVTGFVSSGGSGDRVEIEIRIESDGTTGPPAGSVAYHDENGNGEYDDGEPTYAESDLESIDVAGSLVIAEDATSRNGMDISADSLTVEDGVQLATEFGGIQLTTNDGDLRVGGTLDTTGGSGQSVTLDATGATTLTGGTVRSSGDISVSSAGAVVADDAALDATAASYGSISISGDGAVSMRRASVATQGGITTTAGTSLDATAARFESTGNGQTVGLESSGDMTLDRAAIDVGSSGTMSGTLNQGSNTLFVDAAEFRQNGGPGTFDYSPNGVDVVGEPAVGSTN